MLLPCRLLLPAAMQQGPGSMVAPNRSSFATPTPPYTPAQQQQQQGVPWGNPNQQPGEAQPSTISIPAPLLCPAAVESVLAWMQGDPYVQSVSKWVVTKMTCMGLTATTQIALCHPGA